MKRFTSLIPLSLFVAVVVSLWAPSDSLAQSSAEPEPIVVKMVDKGGGQWRFEPATVTARQGDVVRFVQEDMAPHNVEFTSWPEGAELDAIRMGPFLNQKGQIYEITIDEHFPAGDYAYVCTPHVALGMKGTITVAESGVPHATN